MALSGVEIFKHLPKTNCKKCGHPTCLAFAMKLAAKQASLDACPDASEDAKKILGESAAPPIRGITLGTGDKAVKVGDEISMFRHEKKFFNPHISFIPKPDVGSGQVRHARCDLNIKQFGDHVLSAWTTHPTDPIMGRPL